MSPRHLIASLSILIFVRSFVLLLTVRNSCLAGLKSASFNPCALSPDKLVSLIDCSNPKNPQRAQDVFAARTSFIPGMSAVDIIFEICRLNNNAGESLWRQLMNEFHPDDAIIVDNHTFYCLKEMGVTVS
ncbi:uncharacterized protein LOC111252102 isoform X1 [Varroa destructor]|uniref:Uncharacterized protein n=2 Tax=Varroa TaxID=62624 RepID=A0A7M7KG00_VARDE|nr:uncharacterized protein LOC111252102 isoform X1 [Varroa destructor]